MSTRRRAAFDPNALDTELDSILPTSPTAEDGAAEPAAVNAPAQPRPQLVPSPKVDEATRIQPVKRDRPTAKPRVEPQPESIPAVKRASPPEVAIAAEVYAALRDLTLSERRSNPITARTYGHVVLDAIELHADELQRHWIDKPLPRSGRLFARVSESSGPSRRRHAAAPARVPLAGVINSDTQLLDDLADRWGAGSRSALVEQALRLYLKVQRDFS